jgi:phosphatidylglycerol lysyltransferase
MLMGSLWLTFFSFKHVEYSNELFWQFELSKDAPRALRAWVGAASVATVFMLWRLFRPALLESVLPGFADLNRAYGIVSAVPRTTANLALLGDKTLIFSESGKGLLMYGIEGRSWVALGDPIGSHEEVVELAWRFRELCDRYGGWPVFYEVSPVFLPVYLDLGMSLVKLGEEARVRLAGFSLEGSHRKGFRSIHNRFPKEGYQFSVLSREEVVTKLAELKAISDAWLSSKNTREKGFSLGCFDEDYLNRFPAGIIQQGGKIVAFANLWLGGQNEELSIDLMRHTLDAPNGVMDYLFIELMLWGKQQGYQWFNLGMAPLAGIDDRSLAPLWNKLAARIFRHGENFYNFQGLRGYKEKFDPEWEPRYLAYSGGLALPRILINIASLISGGIKGVVTK